MFFFRPSQRKRVHRQSRPRLGLELLEDRTTPTVITVTTELDVVADDDRVSLREALQAANSNSAVNEAPAGQAGVVDVIRFSRALTGRTIELSQGDLFITGAVTIQGLGARRLTISGEESSRIFNIGNDLPIGPVTIRDLTLTQGASDQGSAIFAILGESDRLVVQRCLFSDNAAFGFQSEGGMGGAIFASFPGEEPTGSLIVQKCLFTENTATNAGGAIWSEAAQTIIQRSTFRGNLTEGSGGAVAIAGNSAFVIATSTFVRNEAVFVGGGLGIGGDTQGFISRSTFSHNTVGLGGGAIGFGIRNRFIGIEGDPQVTMVNSTISGNTSNVEGGGIYIETGMLTLRNVTVTRNRTTTSDGAGIFCADIVSIFNSIIAGNLAANVPNDLGRAGATVNVAFSLIQAPNRSINGFSNHNIVGVSANLGPLRFNGGPTMTHALLPGSRAINAGSNALLAGLLIDQPGRRRIVGGIVDMGAYEAPLLRRVVGHRYIR